MLSSCGTSKSTKAKSSAPSVGSTTSVPAATIATVTNAKLGTILVDGQGSTLYRNTGETAGTIVCTGQCASIWPPLLLSAGASPVAGSGATGKLGTVTRPDGGMQVTYDGSPLYRYASDAHPGDTTGQGVGNVWFVVEATSKPAPTATPTTVAPRPAATVGPTTTVKPTTSTTKSQVTTTVAPTTTAYCAYPPC
jgi:predicted lipoprotein with Yx(FWY)xxD motif